MEIIIKYNMIATIIILTWQIFRLGMRISFHGKTIKIKRNAFIDLLNFIITMILFYFAGLFDKFI